MGIHPSQSLQWGLRHKAFLQLPDEAGASCHLGVPGCHHTSPWGFMTPKGVPKQHFVWAVRAIGFSACNLSNHKTTATYRNNKITHNDNEWPILGSNHEFWCPKPNKTKYKTFHLVSSAKISNAMSLHAMHKGSLGHIVQHVSTSCQYSISVFTDSSLRDQEPWTHAMTGCWSLQSLGDYVLFAS